MILVAIGGTGWPVKFYQGFQAFFFCICFHFISIFRWFLLLQSGGTAGWPVKVSEMPPLAPGAGRKANEDEDKGAQPQLFNIANRGLSLMTKSGQLQTVGDCSINLIGTARSAHHNLKGYVWGLKFYPSRSKEVGVI